MARGAAAPACHRRRFGSLLDDLPHGILHAANGILDFAGGLLGLAVRLQLGIADYLAGGLAIIPVTKQNACAI
jgi:hypothetical protein